MPVPGHRHYHIRHPIRRSKRPPVCRPLPVPRACIEAVCTAGPVLPVILTGKFQPPSRSRGRRAGLLVHVLKVLEKNHGSKMKGGRRGRG